MESVPALMMPLEDTDPQGIALTGNKELGFLTSAGEQVHGPVPLIVHVIYRFDVGGLENGLVNLINRIPVDSFRHLIVCLTDYTNFRERLTQNVEIIALHKPEGQDFKLYWRLWRLMRRLGPEIVHTRNLAALEAQIPAFLAGVPCRIHGEHGWDVHDLDGRSRRYRILRKLFSLFVQRYVTVSSNLATYLRESINVPASKINHICNGVDTERFHPAIGGRQALPVTEFRSHDTIVIGTVGRMEPVKDQLTLARAFMDTINRASYAASRLRLVMVGEGSLKKEIEKVFAQTEHMEALWLPGSREDIPDLLRAMDIFVLPSLAEGISNTILEAMASGLPVVATDVGGNSELVIDGETGFLVPRANPEAMAHAILRYVEDGELRAVHGKNARAKVEQGFSIGEMVDNYLAVYEEALTQCRGKGD